LNFEEKAMKKMIAVFSFILLALVGYAEASQTAGAWVVQEMEARELLKVLGDLPDNPKASSPRHNEMMKKRAVMDMLIAYFAGCKNKQMAATALQTEMSGLKKALPKHALIPLVEELRKYTKR